MKITVAKFIPTFFDPEYLYPLSMIDSVYLDCDTEAQISIFRNTEIRNGFQGNNYYVDARAENPEGRAKNKRQA